MAYLYNHDQIRMKTCPELQQKYYSDPDKLLNFDQILDSPSDFNFNEWVSQCGDIISDIVWFIHMVIPGQNKRRRLIFCKR